MLIIAPHIGSGAVCSVLLYVRLRTLDSAQPPGRITDVKTRLSDILRHNRARADDDVVADGHGQHSRVGADGDVVAEARGFPQLLFPARWAAGGEEVVDKHGPVRDEAVIANFDQLTDKGVRLDFAKAANFHIALYLDKRSDEAALADGAAIKVHRLDDGAVCAELHIHDPALPQLRSVAH